MTNGNDNFVNKIIWRKESKFSNTGIFKKKKRPREAFNQRVVIDYGTLQGHTQYCADRGSFKCNYETRGVVARPARSPDLNFLDFFL